MGPERGLCPPPHVLVVVPAKDEEELVGACVASCLAACAAALADDSARTCGVVVVAHRCSDATAARAEVVARTGPPGVPVLVLEEHEATGPGGARAAGVRHALHWWPHLGQDPRHTWLLGTDADSVVPPDWVTGTLATVATRTPPPVAVAGMVDLAGWEPDGPARAAYDAGIAAGLHDGTHDHVWGANLACRLDAYHRVGGFEDQHAEDRALLDALRRHGLEVTSSVTPVVCTSGRTVGRAPGGMADLLAAMSQDLRAGG